LVYRRKTRNSHRVDELKAAFGELVVPGRRQMAARADYGRTLAGSYGHFDALLVGTEGGVLVHKTRETVAAVQGEKEVRALVWDLTRSPRNPYPRDMPDGLSYPVDVPSLAQSLIVSPHAPANVFDDVKVLVSKHGYGSIPVVKSGFTGFGHFLPTADEIAEILDEK
jgi:hypothetical protein